MNNTKKIIGVDIAKRVFQLHWIESRTGEIVSLQLKREQFLEYFANLVPSLIGMEACGGSQHWARQLQKMGHEVKLLPGKQVKPFVGGNKSDVHDARAIWTAMQQPGIKPVAIKSEEQQAVLALHRMRSQLVKFRTAQINGLRGLLTEYGEVMPQGKVGIKKAIAEALQRLSDRLPSVVIDTLREQWERVSTLDKQVTDIEQRLKQWLKQDPASACIFEIPGSACSRPQRPLPQWATPKPSSRDGNSPLGWVWCRGKVVREGEFGFLELASGVTPTCAPCLSMVRAPY